MDLAWTSKAALWQIRGPSRAERHVRRRASRSAGLGRGLAGGRGNQTFGVDLQLTSTPVYQWYILGETPGNTVDSNEFALWNSAANDFLVECHQTFA